MYDLWWFFNYCWGYWNSVIYQCATVQRPKWVQLTAVQQIAHSLATSIKTHKHAKGQDAFFYLSSQYRKPCCWNGMLTWAQCRNQFRCYSHDSAWVWLSRVFLFCITVPTLFFPELSSQIEWCLCLKAMAIDPHWKWDTTAWAISTMHFICQATLMSATR